MFRDLPRGALSLSFALLLSAGGLSAPGAGHAQERGIVFSQVTVSGSEAGLRLELADGEELSIAFREGRVFVDGEEVGRYASGGPLDAAWRSLLGRAVATEDAGLRELLLDWEPPAEVEDDDREAAGILTNRLRAGLEVPAAAPDAPAETGEAATPLEALIRSPDHLRALAAVARDIRPEPLRIHVGEAVEIGEGDVLAATLLVVDGDLAVEGTVDGDVLLVGGGIRLGPEGRVTGALRWSDARIEGDRDRVDGTIREIIPVAARPEADLREEIRSELQAAAPEATRERAPFPVQAERGLLRHLTRGFSGLLRTLVTFAILLAGGLATLYFFPRHLEVVARTARSATARAGVVGLAGLVLALPLWITGIILLAVSVVGIPLVLVWIPAVPLAVALALAMGYLAVARNLGRWAAFRELPGLTGLDTSRPAMQVGVGLAFLLGVFAVASVFRMGGPWFGIFHAFLTAAGLALTVFALCVGLGAVILSRAGRDPALAGPDWGPAGETDPWAPEPDPFRPEPRPSPPGGEAAPGDPDPTGEPSGEPERGGPDDEASPGPRGPESAESP